MESSDNRTKIILGEYVVSNYKVEKMHNTIKFRIYQYGQSNGTPLPESQRPLSTNALK